LLNAETRVFDDALRDVAPGEVGEPSCFAGPESDAAPRAAA
jgi:hypothetical protein